MSYHDESNKVPEEIIIDDTACGFYGYGYPESKYVSEILLGHACKKLPIKCSIARVGQIAGAVRSPGLWNTAEWFPRLVISSIYLGAIPDSLGPALGSIDWVPIDLLAEILVEVGTSTPPRKHGKPLVLHQINPHPVPWSQILPTFIEQIFALTSRRVDTISRYSWLSMIRKGDEHFAATYKPLQNADLNALVSTNPAAKLDYLYEKFFTQDATKTSQIEIHKSLESSSKLRALESIKTEWMQKWLCEWLNQSNAKARL